MTTLLFVGAIVVVTVVVVLVVIAAKPSGTSAQPAAPGYAPSRAHGQIVEMTRALQAALDARESERAEQAFRDDQLKREMQRLAAIVSPPEAEQPRNVVSGFSQ